MRTGRSKTWGAAGLVLVALGVVALLVVRDRRPEQTPVGGGTEQPTEDSLAELLTDPILTSSERESLGAPESVATDEAVSTVVAPHSGNGLQVAVIRGSVLWPDGTPATGAIVRCERMIEFAEFDLRFEAMVESGDRGEFEIEGTIPAASYWLLASAKPEQETEAIATDRWAAMLAEVNRPTWFAQADRISGDEPNLSLKLDAGAIFRGTVVDDSGAPLSDFSVSTHTSNGMFGRGGVGAPSLTLEGANGEFALSGFYAGRWWIEVQGSNFGGPYESSRRIRFEVPGGNLFGNFVLPRMGSLSGRVVDVYGESVVGASVFSRHSGIRELVVTKMAVTNASGAFLLENCPLGLISVDAEKSGVGESERMEFRLEPNERRSDLVLTVRPASRIIGRIAAEVGDIAQRAVYLFRLAPQSTESVTSQEDGTFTFEALTPGEYRVSLASPYDPNPGPSLEEGSHFAIVPQQSLVVEEGQEVRIVLGSPSSLEHAVTGRVSCRGRPLSGAILTVRTEGDGRSYKSRADESGYFEFATACAGTAHIRITVAESIASLIAEISDAESTRLLLEFPERERTILVRGPDRVPKVSIPVKLFSAVHPATELRAGFTDGQGVARLFGIEPGDYRVSVGHTLESSRRWSFGWREYYSQVLPLRLDGESSEEGPTIEVRLEPGATLEIDIERSDGRGVDGVEVELRYEPRLDPLLWGTPEPAGRNGQVRLGGLHPGRVRVLVREGDQETRSEPIDLRSGVENRVQVVVDF